MRERCLLFFFSRKEKSTPLHYLASSSAVLASNLRGRPNSLFFPATEPRAHRSCKQTHRSSKQTRSSPKSSRADALPATPSPACSPPRLTSRARARGPPPVHEGHARPSLALVRPVTLNRQHCAPTKAAIYRSRTICAIASTAGRTAANQRGSSGCKRSRGLNCSCGATNGSVHRTGGTATEPQR